MRSVGEGHSTNQSVFLEGNCPVGFGVANTQGASGFYAKFGGQIQLVLVSCSSERVATYPRAFLARQQRIQRG